MKTAALWILALSLGITTASALQISEIMSNPTGDDSGREWIELYNNGSETLDITTVTISIKGGTPDPITPLSGGSSIPPNGYAIIGATVGGQTKFTQDYPTFGGLLFKSAITLVNTGTASIDIKLDGVSVDTLSSYTPAKEGKTLSLIGGSFQTGTPTPGEVNQQAPVETPATQNSSAANTQSAAQSGASVVGVLNAQVVDAQTIAQSLPSINGIIVYLPSDKVVVAGAEAEFLAKSSTNTGKVIPNAVYTWSYGDGGQGVGSSTKHSYAYTGKYIAEVEVTNESLSALGRMLVKVISPDITIANVGKDTRGVYVDITNPSPYEINLSQWRLTFDGVSFPFPKNTVVLASSTTRFSGAAMGFGNIAVSSSTTVKILFPHLEEVTRYIKKAEVVTRISTPSSTPTTGVPPITKISKPKQESIYTTKGAASSTVSAYTKSTSTKTLPQSSRVRDTRVVSWVKGLFGFGGK